MVIVGHSPSPALLLLLFAFGVADAIRPLKEGPLIDAEGREYKSGTFRVDKEAVSGTLLNDGSTVRVQCTETSMLIVVKADLYKNGRLVSPGALVLGEAEPPQSSRCRAVAAGYGEYVIEAELQDCGSELIISGDSVIYSNKLVISPAVRNHGILRMTHAVIPLSCHYKRTHFVSSNARSLALTDSASTEHSAFSLKLMKDDWTSETFSSVFYLGDILHLRASYTGPDSEQRRLLIDSCVATLSPHMTSVPRYYFIENHGCLTDAKQGGSDTLFLPRRRAYSLQLQLNTFLFHQDSRNSMFITCQLKAISEKRASSPINKACNYVHSRWKNVDGSDYVCQCCESTCYEGSPLWNNDETNPSREVPEDTLACGTVTLGPLTIFPSK